VLVRLGGASSAAVEAGAGAGTGPGNWQRPRPARIELPPSPASFDTPPPADYAPGRPRRLASTRAYLSSTWVNTDAVTSPRCPQTTPADHCSAPILALCRSNTTLMTMGDETSTITPPLGLGDDTRLLGLSYDECAEMDSPQRAASSVVAGIRWLGDQRCGPESSERVDAAPTSESRAQQTSEARGATPAFNGFFGGDSFDGDSIVDVSAT